MNVPDTDIRRAPLLSVAHLARRLRTVSTPAVAALIARANADEALAGTLDDLQDDLNTFGIAL